MNVDLFKLASELAAYLWTYGVPAALVFGTQEFISQHEQGAPEKRRAGNRERQCRLRANRRGAVTVTLRDPQNANHAAELQLGFEVSLPKGLVHELEGNW